MVTKKDVVLKRIEQDESLKHDIKFSERIAKIFELFGEEEGVKTLHVEHRETAKLEQHYTELRWTVFTTLTAISFAIAGYTLSTLNTLHLPTRIVALFFAWFVQFFATFFYWWMHGLTHHLREYLQQLESILGLYGYTLRSKRPVPAWTVFKRQIQFKFHWVVYGVTALYLVGIIGLTIVMLGTK
ncbi:MAG TPA: hypothetical protein ENI23_08080 [bacterium]|nr:hypothetical protein [bacterium]